MTHLDPVRAAASAGVLSKEALAFFWVLDYCRQYDCLPSIKAVSRGYQQAYGETLPYPTAGRARKKAERQIRELSQLKKPP